MARKEKHRGKGGKPSPTASDPAALPGRAAAALAAGQFKEAMEGYKELLKRERRPEWLDALAEAYAGRARQLAAKGMAKEALVLWRNRAELCGKPIAAGDEVALLAAAGQVAEATRRYLQHPAPEELKGLEPQLATALLAAPDAALAALPGDAPLLRQRAAALAALAACESGDAAALEAALAAIPFRSPYRELRPLLKGLTLVATAPVEALKAVARVAADSPFGRLAAAVRAAALPAPQWFAALLPLDDEARRLVLDLKGVAPALLPFFLKLAALGQRPAAAPLQELLLAEHYRFPQEAVAALCRRLLPHLQGERYWQRHVRAFGAMSAPAALRLLALSCELQGDFAAAERYWLDLTDRLEEEGEGEAPRLEAALILRRLVKKTRPPAAEASLDIEAVEWLTRSLRLDPGHRDSYLQAIPALLADGGLKEARTHLAAALERFPDDAELLLQAVATAVAGSAFKKAAGYARRVLALDPINPRVHALLGRAHLAHARKQVAARKREAAERELKEAAEWLREPADRAALLTLRALAAPSRSGEAAALAQEALAAAGGAPGGLLHVALELRRNRLSVSHALADLKIALPKRFTPEEAVAVAGAVMALEEETELHGLLAVLEAPLEKALAGRFEEADALLLCEALRRCRSRWLTQRCAAAARKRYRHNPAFVYFELEARFGDYPRNLPAREEGELERAKAAALEQGDRRTAARIEQLLERSFGPSGPFGPYGGPFDISDDDDDDEEWEEDDLPFPPIETLEELLEDLGEKEFHRTLRLHLGDATYRMLEQMAEGRPLIEVLRELGKLSDALPPPRRSSPPKRRMPPKPPKAEPPKPAQRRDKTPPPKQRNLFDDE